MPSHRLPSARTPQAARCWSFASLGLLFAVVVIAPGCAVPGEPTARHPVIPEAVRDLVARQQGNEVMLSFTPPKTNTDQKPLAAPPTVEVYRSAATAPGAPPSKMAPHLADTVPGSAVETYTKSGHVELPDALDATTITNNAGQQITYFVRTRVSAKHESTNSNATSVIVFPPPLPVGELHATVKEDAIELAWTAPVPSSTAPMITGYRVYRAEVPAPSGVTSTPLPASSKSALSAPIALLGQPPQPNYRDTTFEFGHSYFYVVRSIAQFGNETVESANSTPLLVSAKDTFAPSTPQGLEAVIVPETAGVPAYVELVWNISPEADLMGYVVFRSEQSDTPGQRLTPESLSAPTFRDITVASGRHYFYRVEAIDRDGNVSPLSAEVEAAVP
jgi:hypothetical protein